MSVRLYHFDGIDEELDLVPLAARRALDRAGAKLSLEGWRSLSLPARRALTDAGSAPLVEIDAVLTAAGDAEPRPVRIDPVDDPPASAVPPQVALAFGSERPIAPAVWAALAPIDRYALMKVAERGRAERLGGAYDEIIGASALSTHLDSKGQARMVDVSAKAASLRRAVAESRVRLGPEAIERMRGANVPKGDVLGTARLAGIMAAKRTPDVIPLCHPISLTHVSVDLELDLEQSAVRIVATVEAFDRTGVEIEALHAASAAALTVYDMLKAFDRKMEIGPTRLLSKSGGRSGDFGA
jgi:cyclic pyranopterin monophosphate synthase